MQFNELQKQTNTNIQEKAILIWESATHLVGLFKPHEYGKVMAELPYGTSGRSGVAAAARAISISTAC